MDFPNWRTGIYAEEFFLDICFLIFLSIIVFIMSRKNEIKLIAQKCFDLWLAALLWYITLSTLHSLALNILSKVLSVFSSPFFSRAMNIELFVGSLYGLLN